MSSHLELHDSRVSRIEWVDGVVMVHFSHAHIRKSQGKSGRDLGTSWSREVGLILREATATGPMPALPNTISEGYIEVGGIRHEDIPLPFQRKVDARLLLIFIDGAQVEIIGKRPTIVLLGTPIYLENYS